MTPFHFGPPSRTLLGIHHAPIPDSERGRCVLLCNPFGQEAIRSHRLFRLLADRLCRSGFHVLRFDFFGTGDSAGEDGEGDLRVWEEDVIYANQELLSRSGCHSSSLFGLRLGATLAAVATRQIPGIIDQLVMWEPILDGKHYLEELFAEQERALQYSYGVRWHCDQVLRTQIAQNSGHEALGFAINSMLFGQLGEIHEDVLERALSGETRVFYGPDDASKFERVRGRLITAGADSATRFFPANGNICWTADEMMDASVAPADLLSSITSAFEARA